MSKMRRIFLLILVTIICCGASAQPTGGYGFKIAKLKYDGGGDWYANKSSLKNLFIYIRQNSRMNVFLEEEIVDPGNAQIFQYPMIYATGHGNMLFSSAEAANLRKYLLGGGFMLIDDNYGLNKYARREIKKIFPEYELVELPFNHPIFHQQYQIAGGLPKVHEHDGKPAQAFGIIHEGRLLLLLTFESDLGDGWEDPAVHHDPQEVRLKALQMGTNIVMYVLNQ